MSSLTLIADQVFTNGKVQPAIISVDNGKISKILLHPTSEDKKIAEKNARVITGFFFQNFLIITVPSEDIVLPGIVDRKSVV